MKTNLGSRTIVAALLLAGLAHCGQANAESSTWCNSRGKCWTRTYFAPAPAAPAVQYIEPETPADEAARADRVRKWEALCQPHAVVGADGISRYQYALPGCDTGRTQ